MQAGIGFNYTCHQPRRPRLLAASLLAFAIAGYGTTSPASDFAYISNQGDGLTVLKLPSLKPITNVDMHGAGPRGIAVTPDGKYILTADEHTENMSVIDAHTLKVVRQIHIGRNPEFMRILPDGSEAFVTYEPSSTGGKPVPGQKENDEDELPGHIAVIDLHDWKVVGDITGAPETEGIEFTPNMKDLVVANEGDDTLSVYNYADHKLIKKVNLAKYGLRPRGVKRSPDGKHYIVTMELSGNFLVLNDNLKVLKSVKTARGPYGVAFDRSGNRIIVSAARGPRLQVFDAHTYKRLASIPVGKRCWHFSFIPDESKLLLACGRSNNVEVVNMKTYKVAEKLPGFKLPWGIVTYPKSFGSLDAVSMH